jgi:hypothetical protein
MDAILAVVLFAIAVIAILNLIYPSPGGPYGDGSDYD